MAGEVSAQDSFELHPIPSKYQMHHYEDHTDQTLRKMCNVVPDDPQIEHGVRQSNATVAIL
jgi:hypothetical protein